MIIIRIALVFHLCFSIWNYTTQDIWATKIYFSNGDVAYTKDQEIYYRLITDNGLPLTILVGICLVTYLLEYTLVNSLCYCRKRKKRFKLSKIEEKAP